MVGGARRLMVFVLLTGVGVALINGPARAQERKSALKLLALATHNYEATYGPTAAEYESRIRALDWDGLRLLWAAIQRRDTPGWDSGKAFEYLVLRAFELDQARVRWPYTVDLFGEPIEQLDGAVHARGLSCLVESKDFVEDIAIGPIAKLRNQLLRRPAGTVGLMFSSSDFTSPAIMLAHFVLPQTILLWRGTEVADALEQKRICDLLEVKYRICVEQGMPDYRAHTRGVP